MIVGWSPSSVETTQDWANGVAGASLVEINSLLRDVDLEVPRRLIVGAMFDLSYLGATTIFSRSVASAKTIANPNEGEVFAVDSAFNIVKIDPFLGVVDTGLNCTNASTSIVEGSPLNSGEIFFRGATVASTTKGTLLHTNYTAVTNITTGSSADAIAEYRYCPTNGKYYRLLTTGGATSAQYATSATGSWTNLATMTAIGFELNTDFPYLAVATTGDLGVSIYNNITLINSRSGSIVGSLATYTQIRKIWFWKNRMYLLVRNNAASFWAILRSDDAPGFSDQSANLMNLEVVYERSGTANTESVGSTESMTSFTSSSTLVWSLDGTVWNQTEIGSTSEGRVAGNRLWFARSVSRWI